MLPKVAALQMTSTMDIDTNCRAAEQLISQAAEQGACLAVLPENFSMLGIGADYRAAKLSAQEDLGQGFVQDFLSAQAIKHKIWIIGGTIPIRSHDPLKSYATSIVFNDQGQQVAHYHKINLFDVVLNNTESYQESASIVPGSEITVIDTPVGKLGLSICFDVRFPELFRSMSQQGAEIFALPSAFTVPTGLAHWDTLTRAIAVQNFAYVIASAQVGVHGMGRKTYGHSRIIDPDGKVMSELAQDPGVIVSPVDMTRVHDMRRVIPMMRKFPS